MSATRYYNHMNAPTQRKPLEIVEHELPADPPRPPGLMHSVCVAVPQANDRVIRLRLDTDSSHLAMFFRLNWPEDPHVAPPDGRILALSSSPSTYGLPSEPASFRRYCPRSHQVWIVGSEFYGNVKITVRGLCSELAQPDEMFVHGCSMRVGGRGLLLSGMSGAGKTTLTAAIRRANPIDAHIINDDWGPLSLSTGRLLTTSEPHLHMKYPSVCAIAPQLPLDPGRYPSEDFGGSANDPRARLMIQPRTVFGPTGLVNESALDLFVIVRRTTTSDRPSLSAPDLAELERGQRSDFYERQECFLNGSLFLTSRPLRARQRTIHAELLRRFRAVVLDNCGRPEDGAKLILDRLAD